MHVAWLLFFASHMGLADAPSYNYACPMPEDGGPGSLSWSQDGRFVLFENPLSKKLCFRDTQSGGIAELWNGYGAGAWQPGGHHFAAWQDHEGGGLKRGIKVIDAETGRTVVSREQTDPQVNVVSLSYSSDGRFLAQVSQAHGFQVLDAQTLEAVPGTPAPDAHQQHYTGHVVWRPGTHQLIALHIGKDADDWYERLALFDADTEKVFSATDLSVGAYDQAFAPVWSPDGSSFVADAASGRYAVYAATGDVLAKLPKDTRYFGLTWNPTADLLAGTTFFGLVAIDPFTGEQLGKTGSQQQVLWAPANWLDADQLLATWKEQGGLWAVNARQRTWTQVSAATPAFGLMRLSPDKQYLTLAYEPAKGQVIMRIRDGAILPGTAFTKGPIYDAVWNADSRRVAYTVRDGVVVVTVPDGM